MTYPPAPPPYGARKTNRGLIIGLVALGVVLLGATAAGVGWLVLRTSDSAGATSRQAEPIRFQQVTAEAPGSCTSGGTPSADGSTCFQVSDGMTVTHLRKIRLVPPGPGNPAWRIEIDLNASDARAFTALTQKVSTETPGTPQQKIAIVVGSRVVSAPAVQSTITGGSVEIQGGFTEQSAQQLFHQITG